MTQSIRSSNVTFNLAAYANEASSTLDLEPLNSPVGDTDLKILSISSGMASIAESGHS